MREVAFGIDGVEDDLNPAEGTVNYGRLAFTTRRYPSEHPALCDKFMSSWYGGKSRSIFVSV